MAKHLLLPRRMGRVAHDSTLLRHAAWLVEVALLGLLWGFAALLPLDRASRLGRAVMQWLGPRSRKSKHAQQNLSIALPERSPEERNALAVGVFGSWGAMLGELPHTDSIIAEGRIEIDTPGRMRALREPDRPTVFVTAHTANWELAAVALVTLGQRLTVVYTPNSNPYTDRFLTHFRRRLRCRLIERDGSTRVLLRDLKAGRSVGLVVDYRVDQGELIPFFGVPTPTTLVPARLALSVGCELVPVRVERLEGARFRVTLYDPVEPDDPSAHHREQARQMTRRVNALFESWIRERPEQWLCTSRRFPKETLRALEAGASGASLSGLRSGAPSDIDGASPAQRAPTR